MLFRLYLSIERAVQEVAKVVSFEKFWCGPAALIAIYFPQRMLRKELLSYPSSPSYLLKNDFDFVISFVVIS